MKENTVATIYRVENSMGVGPYTFDLSFCEKLARWHDNCPAHPIPLEDPAIGRHILISEFCGFASLDQLHAWFSKRDLDLCKLNGFDIVKITGFVTAVGAHQVLFQKVEIFVKEVLT